MMRTGRNAPGHLAATGRRWIETYLQGLALPVFLALAILSGCGNADEKDSPDPGPRIRSAFHGLASLPEVLGLICPEEAIGIDGMPIVFSVQIKEESLDPSDFGVEMESGRTVIPACATLRPAVEPLERHTVLLAADLSSHGDVPVAVEIIGPLRDTDENLLTGLRIERVTPLGAGPSLVDAERFAPDTHGLANECPARTLQVVQLTWEGGVHAYPGHGRLGEPQLRGTRISLDNGNEIHPFAWADDDVDNYVHACLDSDSPAHTVTIEADLFEDPRGDPNARTRIEVRPHEAARSSLP